MINPVHKDKTIDIPKDGQFLPLENNQKIDFASIENTCLALKENDALEYLADILVETFLIKKKNERNKSTKKSSNLL
jgi:hypothetical protein